MVTVIAVLGLVVAVVSGAVVGDDAAAKRARKVARDAKAKSARYDLMIKRDEVRAKRYAEARRVNEEIRAAARVQVARKLREAGY